MSLASRQALWVAAFTSLAGCATPNVVDRALLEAEQSQRSLHQVELAEIGRSRQAKLDEYRLALADQERQYEALVQDNRGVKQQIDAEQGSLTAARGALAAVTAERGVAEQEADQLR